MTAAITMKRNATMRTRIDRVDLAVPGLRGRHKGLHACVSAAGKRATMPTVMMSEMPLPMPRSVIWSPSHISNSVPGRQGEDRESRKPIPGSTTSGMPRLAGSCP